MYRRKKIGFMVAAIISGAMMLPMTIPVAAAGGPIAIPIIGGTIFITFLVLAIIFRNKDQHYWYPKAVKCLPSLNGSAAASYLYRRIKETFPDLPIKTTFVFNRANFDKMHIECRKVRPNPITVQRVAQDIWRHIGLATECPTIYIVQKAEKPFFGEQTELAGFADTNYRERTIMVTFKRGFSVDTFICLLAHEMAHFYQFDNGRVFEGWDAEILTDAMTAFFGLGDAFYAGRHWSYVQRGATSTTTISGKIGYIPDRTYGELLYLLDRGVNAAPGKDQAIASLRSLLSEYERSYQLTYEKVKIQVDLLGGCSAVFAKKFDAAKNLKFFLDDYPPAVMKEKLDRLATNFNENDRRELESVFAIKEILEIRFLGVD